MSIFFSQLKLAKKAKITKGIDSKNVTLIKAIKLEIQVFIYNLTAIKKDCLLI